MRDMDFSRGAQASMIRNSWKSHWTIEHWRKGERINVRDPNAGGKPCKTQAVQTSIPLMQNKHHHWSYWHQNIPRTPQQQPKKKSNGKEKHLLSTLSRWQITYKRHQTSIARPELAMFIHVFHVPAFMHHPKNGDQHLISQVILGPCQKLTAWGLMMLDDLSFSVFHHLIKSKISSAHTCLSHRAQVQFHRCKDSWTPQSQRKSPRILQRCSLEAAACSQWKSP